MADIHSTVHIYLSYTYTHEKKEFGCFLILFIFVCLCVYFILQCDTMWGYDTPDIIKWLEGTSSTTNKTAQNLKNMYCICTVYILHLFWLQTLYDNGTQCLDQYPDSECF